MPEPFVSIQKDKGWPVVKVSIGDNIKSYTLNFEGCRQAGRDLFNAGAESWMCSSSVDFPQEVLLGFRGDVRELITEGYQQAMDKGNKPRKTTIAKILAHCSKPEFTKTLTPTELKEFNKIKSEYEDV